MRFRHPRWSAPAREIPRRRDRADRGRERGPIRGWLSRAAVCAALTAPVIAQQLSAFDVVRARARDLARGDPVQRPTNDLPEWLAKLDYDGYRRIRFRPEMSLWAGEDVPFCLQFLHRGYLFREKVPI